MVLPNAMTHRADGKFLVFLGSILELLLGRERNGFFASRRRLRPSYDQTAFKRPAPRRPKVGDWNLALTIDLGRVDHSVTELPGFAERAHQRRSPVHV